MRTRFAGLFLLAAFVPGCASVPVERPEGTVPVEPGDRVRVTLSNRFAPAPLVGTVEAVSADALTVRRKEGGIRWLTPEQVDAVGVSVARRRDPAGAAGEGILAGAPLLIPLVVVLVLAGDEIEGDVFSPIVAIVALPIALLALTGAVIGGGPQDVWVEAIWPAEPETVGPPDSAPAGPGPERVAPADSALLWGR